MAEPKPKAPTKPKLVKMQRDDGKTADVPAEMVEEYRKGGYSEAK